MDPEVPPFERRTPEILPEAQAAYESLRNAVDDLFVRWADFLERADRNRDVVLSRKLKLITDDAVTLDVQRAETDVRPDGLIAPLAITRAFHQPQFEMFEDDGVVVRQRHVDRDQTAPDGKWKPPRPDDSDAFVEAMVEGLANMENEAANRRLEEDLGLNNQPASPGNVTQLIDELRSAVPDIEYYTWKTRSGAFDEDIDWSKYE